MSKLDLPPIYSMQVYYTFVQFVKKMLHEIKWAFRVDGFKTILRGENETHRTFSIYKTVISPIIYFDCILKVH